MFFSANLTLLLTRMHSSGIRTTRLLTVSQHALGQCLPKGGICLGVWGVCPGGLPVGWWVSAQGVCPGGGCVGDVFQHAVGQTSFTPPPPWTDRHLWKHNLRKLRLREVKMLNVKKKFAYKNKPFLYCNYKDTNKTTFTALITNFIQTK